MAASIADNKLTINLTASGVASNGSVRYTRHALSLSKRYSPSEGTTTVAYGLNRRHQQNDNTRSYQYFHGRDGFAPLSVR
jgi:hypothetical protein